MQLVIFHYHLNRGGVTSVIRSHLQSLATLASEFKIQGVALAYGGRATDWSREFEQDLPFPVDHLVIPSLEYDELRTVGNDLRVSIQHALDTGGYAPQSTILHAHNHALGKNAELPHALGQLANQGWRVLLQVHDFVEDLRPANYQHLLSTHHDDEQLWSNLYPQAPQIRYATLNEADRDTLQTAGIDETQLHLLPNPVAHEVERDELRMTARHKLADVYSVSEDRPYVLYPVRGIRRKNLGELLLWSVLLKECTFSVTLEPKNEIERKSYLAWKEFADSLSLPVLFGSGEQMSLDENYAAADAVISTSVAEGFGLVFLEAALRNRLLFGRNLPGVTADFVRSGMRFPGLVDELLIPAEHIDQQALRATSEQLTLRLRHDYRVAEPDPATDPPVTDVGQKRLIDFGQLDTQQQRNLVAKANSDPTLAQWIANENPIIESVRRALLDGQRNTLDASAENRDVIKEHYSLQTIGRKLVDIFQTLLRCEPKLVQSKPTIGRNLLKQFVQPQNLLPIRIES